VKVFNDLGMGMLDNVWQGYNCCILAYGQTGSGKSYSIMGHGVNKGAVWKNESEFAPKVFFSVRFGAKDL
jgi:hypothetical protein